MIIYLGGSEIPGHRTMLEAEGVEHVSLSYMGLRRRTKFVRPWSLAEKYVGAEKVFLDSGAYTVNKDDGDKYTQAELKDIAAHYMSFVGDNIDRVSIVSEFDCLALGKEWIEAMREDFYDDLPEDVFLPIWHGEWGLDELDRMAQKYRRVGVFSTDLNGRNITPFLNGLVQKYGTLLHGVNMSKVDDMSAVKWDTISTISWLSPSQYGDTIVWVRNELKRYPKKYKDSSRKRHRTLFIDAGFDAEKIEADDKDELLRLSIWSWLQLEQSINHHQTDRVVNTLPETDDGANAQVDPLGVVMTTSEIVNSASTELQPVDRPLINFPLLQTVGMRETYIEDGESKERIVPLLTARSASMRQCRSCFLAKKCPAFDEASNCAYDMPVEIKSRDQLLALQNTLIEMQTQRIMFMRMAEDLEGGYADPNLSSEMDRLQKLVKTKHEMEQEGFSLKIEARGNGQAGMISRLFGSDAGDSRKALPATITVEQVMEAQDIEFEEMGS